jgi:PAS domain S-box-containing protein
MQDQPGRLDTLHLNILDTLPLLVVDVDRYGNILFANKKAQQSLGLPEDTEDITLEQLLDQNSGVAAMKLIEQLFSGEGDVTTTWRLNIPATETYVTVNAVAIVENDYRIRVRIYMHNMSESSTISPSPSPLPTSMATGESQAISLPGQKKKPASATTEEREYLNALLQKSGVLVYIFDKQGDLLEVNRRMVEVTGFSLSNVTSLAELLTGLYPDRKDRSMVHHLHSDMFRAKHAKALELEIHTRSGDTRFVSWSSGSLKSSDSKTKGFIVIGIDVTDKKHLEQFISTQTELLDRVSEGLVVMDQKSRILKWMGGAERLLQYSETQVRGRPFCAIFPREKRKNIEHSLLLSMKQTGKWTGTILTRTANKKNIVLQVSVTLLRDKKKEPIGMTAVLEDKTREKKLEAACRSAMGRVPDL